MIKIDLHCHSRYSARPSEWILQKLKCPESFTEPEQLYRIMLAKGMSHVTITDHNAIDGCLELAHYPNTFTSVELTSYFPEDGCKLHVLAYRLSEKQFGQCQKLRPNVYDLVTYLNQERIFHALAHPLFAINGKLTYDNFEKMILLFRIFELNGSRNEMLNDCLKLIVSQLTVSDMMRLVEKHRMIPPFGPPWDKHFIGGSDDHSSLSLACRHTSVDRVETLDEYFRAAASGKAQVLGRSASPAGFARNLYGIAYQFYRKRLGINEAGSENLIFEVLNRYLLSSEKRKKRGFTLSQKFRFVLRRKKKTPPPASAPLFDLFKHEVHQLMDDRVELSRILNRENKSLETLDEPWLDLITLVSNKLLMRFNTQQLRSLFQASFFELIHAASSASTLYFILAPYFLSYSLFSKDIRFAKAISRKFLKPMKNPPVFMDHTRVKVAHFTDTFYDLNGVAGTLRRQAETARKLGKQYTIITCDSEKRPDLPGVMNFKPIATFKLEEYREQKFYYPPFLEILNYCYRENFTHIHAATPGPIGLSAIAVAKILNIPIVGTYHTAFPKYVRYFTDDNAMEGFLWKYMLWYYKQMACVFVPSRSTGQDLILKGLNPEKVQAYPRGVNIEEFHPDKRNGVYKNDRLEGRLKLLYVGRISREKDLPLLARSFRKLCHFRDDLSLVIVGDGPYLEDMKRETGGLPVVFKGRLLGEDLAAAYASSDLFVFPSTTDTFGNVVLEAQASGIPVIVTDMGGPQENLRPGKTGFIVKAHDEKALTEAINAITQDRKRLTAMGRAARRYMEGRSFEKAFEASWELYKNIRFDLEDAFPEDAAHGIPEKIASRLAHPFVPFNPGL